MNSAALLPLHAGGIGPDELLIMIIPMAVIIVLIVIIGQRNQSAQEDADPEIQPRTEPVAVPRPTDCHD